MGNGYFEDETFESINYKEKRIPAGSYELCRFVDCDFSEADLSGLQFTECEFSGCNMSMVKLNNTAFNDIKFVDCKLQGANFEPCNTVLFSVSFEKCILNYSSFYKRSLKKARFSVCTIHEADFTEADLSGSVFESCDLHNTRFENTLLEKADLRTSFNFSIDPEKNKIKKAVFSVPGVLALLEKFDIVIK
ncbi:pentapeptide repeat-containing protein [Flavihumibacter solisilvae]|uniref:Pentapeptide repeat-containing protein n=1 Tax=Flavihumibacter solisilvae TaxID=1349421 RepID=A0A0C1IGU6_9BACT|nr:pentapeptide repeat-containing protein [Flavihumibacter solisilvae]KIC93415.1 hypothetical protein OI18_16690 [Flavihumibacter solisilvae]